VDLAVTAAPALAVERPRLATLAIYGTGIGLSAFLLFSVEPLVGRLALPVFGGVPSAWATVLAFFQGVLLLGYLYGHVSVTRLGLRRGALVHVAVAVLALALLLAAPADWASLRDASIPPGLNLLAILTVTVGPAAFLLTATTPLLSAWYAAVRDAETLGASLLAVRPQRGLAGSWPTLVIEWRSAHRQRAVWTAAIGVPCWCAAAAWRVRRAAALAPDRCLPTAGGSAVEPCCAVGSSQRRGCATDHTRAACAERLAAIPTGLLTAVTTFIATDLVSAPLLWVGPLALYLASFVVAFSGRGGTLVRWATIGAPAAATLLWVPLGSGGIWPLVPLVLVELGGYAVVATALHGRLAADRPAARHLTEFYLVLALAGVVAGGFVALVAPVIFPDVWEYPLLVGFAVAAFVLTAPATERAMRVARHGPRQALDFGPFLPASFPARPYVVVRPSPR
jgi:hypothetical protein